MSFVGDFVGDILGADDAADAQIAASNQQQEVAKDIYEQQKELISPFVQFGTGLLGQMGSAISPLDREAELAAYYQSPEYAMQADQARNQQLAAAEATGGLGSTSTGNALASISPQLGQNYLSQQYAQQADLYNRLMGGINVGLSAAGGQSAAAGQMGSQVSNAIGQAGAAQAGASLAGGQLLGQLGGIALGGYMGGGF